MSTLEITNLHVSVETQDGPKPILKGVDLTLKSGEIHAPTARASRRSPTPSPATPSTRSPRAP